jgi:hypothetical protein
MIDINEINLINTSPFKMTEIEPSGVTFSIPYTVKRLPRKLKKKSKKLEVYLNKIKEEFDLEDTTEAIYFIAKNINGKY